MKLSIVVPMLNESDELPDLLAHLQIWAAKGCEVILVDGGSHDASVAMAQQHGFKVIVANRGRARQMNAGARVASGEVLLFLHADTRLPADSDKLIGQRFGYTSQAVWGRFDVQITGSAYAFKLIALGMNLRSRLTAIATGDQAIFVSRCAFESIGGFPDQPLMEDIELSARLKKLSRPLCISSKVKTSGRRWSSRGILRTQWLMWRLRWAYWLGASAENLAQRYR